MENCTQSDGLSEAWAHVYKVVEASGSSFVSGMKVLPKDRRDAMFAIYSFCREIDDIADDPLPYLEKKNQLNAWREELESLYHGKPTKPTAKALLIPIKEYQLRKEDFVALIDGMEMDAQDDFCAPTMENLKLYCARVAGAVGLLSVRVFGEKSPARDDVARSLGLALQLTNILRDLHEDAGRGRLYLPLELLKKHGVCSENPKLVLSHPAIDLICKDLADIAENSFSDAILAMALCSRKTMRPAVVMMHGYSAILKKLRVRGWRKTTEPVVLSKFQKIWIVLRYGVF